MARTRHTYCISCVIAICIVCSVVACIAWSGIIGCGCAGTEHFYSSSDRPKCFVINLERNADRRAEFRANWTSDMTFEFTTAVDGRVLDVPRLLTDGLLSQEAHRSISNVNAGLPRRSVADLGSVGAIGCYLSHVLLWEHMLKTPDVPYICVFEDDAINNVNSADLRRRVEALPDDWHIYLWGRPHTRLATQRVPNHDHVLRVTEFCGTHAYVLSRAGVAWLHKHGRAFPIYVQIDAKMSELTGSGLNVYMHPHMPFIRYIQDASSDIQAGIVVDV
jgi:GR25 family glycosyltransferase involved in LPS biosynthesis